jgi:hypothetical protein
MTTEVPLAQMKPTDAVLLENCVCRAAAVEVRRGWVSYTTGFGSSVETLLPYQSLSGTTDKLFAAAGASFYDATSTGVVGAAVATGFTSSYWAYTQLSNVAGNYLIAVNGADAGQIYNGTVWAAWGATGIATTLLRQVAVWKRRVWAVENNSFKAWYGAADAIAGALTQFPLQGVFRRGGRLQAIIPWTIDAGVGMDDHLVFVTSQGEAAIYKGTDPASATTFELQGIYYIGAPIGERFWTEVGGDLLLLTKTGLVALSEFLRQGQDSREAVKSDRIRTLLLSDIDAVGSTVGWEVINYTEENLLFIQVPGEGGVPYQYVMNTLTGAWSKLTMTEVQTFSIFQGNLFGGHTTKTAQYWSGGVDGTEPIHYKIVPAFNTFGSPAQGKKFNLGRVLFEADYPPVYRTKLLIDYNSRYSIPSFSMTLTSGALWDVALWDAAVWSGAIATYNKIYSLTGHGRSGTVAFEGYSVGVTVRFVSFEYTFEAGGPL